MEPVKRYELPNDTEAIGDSGWLVLPCGTRLVVAEDFAQVEAERDALARRVAELEATAQDYSLSRTGLGNRGPGFDPMTDLLPPVRAAGGE